MNSTGTILAFLQCSKCGGQFSKKEIHNLSPCCSLPLFPRYDIEKGKVYFKKDSLINRPPTMWRYKEMMPVNYEENITTLGEGFTPLEPAGSLGKMLGFKNLFLKNESINPTGSFKDRGMSAAISKAREFGLNKISIPTAGNAGGATAAYTAKAGQEAFIFMPDDTPKAFQVECEQYGAHVEMIDGLISDCGKIVAERKEQEGWFDISTLKEPYRVEGKKTMGYELAEQLNWELPDVIIYPTGGGTGIIGMWKAFDEMEKLGWIGSHRPKMISVQSEGCAPIIHAFEQGKDTADFFENPETSALGLRVPAAIGDFLILKAIRESNGYALTVSDKELMDNVKMIGKHEGIFSSPEGGATVATLPKLLDLGVINSKDRIVLFITGSGLKYVDLF
ncbi:MAG: threonine synthase [Candidatus Marinimicrobia bacterium]|nr:threonine synthase [Candidatus Neomarinimicrobiota bacterium]